MCIGLNYFSILTTRCEDVHWTELLQYFDYTMWKCALDWITSVFWLHVVKMWIGLNYFSVLTTQCEEVNWTELRQYFDYRM